MIRMIFAVFAAVTVTTSAKAAVEIQEVVSPGGITAWLVEEHSIPFTALEIRFRGGAALDEAVAEFIEEGVDSEQLARIKQQIRASLIYSDDDVQALARRYGAGLTQGLTVEDIEAWPALLDAVTEDDIIEAAKMIFDRDKAVTGWLMGPETGEEATQ